MGLDMYLYRVSKPDVTEGLKYTENQLDELMGETMIKFNEEDYKAFPYKNLCVKIEILNRYKEIGQILIDAAGLTEDMCLSSYYSGKHYEENKVVDIMRITVKKGSKLKTGLMTVVELDNGFAIRVNVELTEDDVEADTYRAEIIFENSFTEDGEPNYTGKYIIEQYDTVYVTEMDEICYQRKGLTEEGWAALPENCSYCGDKRVVETLCKTGGLDEQFLSHWEDGETVFHPWW